MKKLLFPILLILISNISYSQDTIILKVQKRSSGIVRTSEAKVSQMIHDSLATMNLKGYTKSQVDSIASQIRSEITGGVVTETDPVVKAINGIVKSNGTTISAAVAGTDYLPINGSAAALTSFPTFNQSTTGNAATATTSITASKLTVSRTIAGVPFDGSSNISLNNNAITNGASYITASSLSTYAPLINPIFVTSVTLPTTWKIGSTTITPTATELNYVSGVTSPIQAQLNSKAVISGTGFVKASGSTISYDNSTYLTTASAASTYAPITSPSLLGTPLTVTPTAGDSSTKIASTAFTKFAIASNVFLDTLVTPIHYVPKVGTVIDTLSTTKDGIVLKGGITANNDTLATKSYARSVGGTGGDPHFNVDSIYARNYINDSAALANGLHVKDIYRNGSQLMMVTIAALPSPFFNYTIDNTDGTANSYSMAISGFGSSFPVKILWGDGTGDSTTYVSASSYTPSHTYSGAGPFNVIVSTTGATKPDVININTVSGSAIKIVNIKNIAALNTSLYQFQAQNARLTNTITDTLTYPSGLKALSLGQNSLTGFNPTHTLPNLLSLSLNDNPYTTNFAPTLGLPSTLTSLNIRGISGSAWTTTNTYVNAALVWMDSQTFAAGAKTLNIKQYNIAAAPSGAGSTAKTSLTGKGWTVTTD